MTDDLVNLETLSVQIGWAMPTIRRWIKLYPDFPIEGEGRRGRKWQFNVKKVRKWIKEHSKEKRETKPSTPDGLRPIDKLNLERYEQVRMQNEMLRGNLIEVAALEEQLADTMVMLARFLDELPERMRSELEIPDIKAQQVALWLEEERNRLVQSIKELNKSVVQPSETPEG